MSEEPTILDVILSRRVLHVPMYYVVKGEGYRSEYLYE